MKSPNNLQYITIAQIIGCGLVIFGHSYPFVTEVPQLFVEMKQFLYLFHMPLFVWCSGFLFSYTDQTRRYSFGQFAGKRAKKLLLPYVILSVIGIAPKVLFSSVLNDSLSFDTTSLIRAFLIPRENIWGHFWFLPMIYLLGVMGFIIDKILVHMKYRNILLLLILVWLLAVSNTETETGKWLGMNDILHYGWIYILGMFVAQNGIPVLQELSENRKLLYTLGCGSMLVSIMLYGLIPFSFLVKESIAVLMIGSMLSFGMLISRKVRITRGSLIAQTYQLFILSWPCQLITEILTERIFHLPWWTIMLSVFVTGVCIPMLLIGFLDRFEGKPGIKILSLILGR